MRHYLIASLILVAVSLSLIIPQANALPVSYNQTALNFGLTSVPRNSSSYDVFTLNQDNWLWLKFDNTITDSSPLSINQTLTGVSSFVTGKYSQAFNFTGATYIQTGSKASYNLISKGQPFTLSYWSKIAVGGLAGTPIIFDNIQGGALGDTGFIEFITATGSINFDVANGGGVGYPLSLSSAAGAYPNDGAYHYVAFDFDGTTLTLYVDGLSVTSVAKSGTQAFSTSTTTTQVTHIGSRGDGAANFLTGQLDNIKLYPYSLSSSQITTDQSVSAISSGKQFMSWYNGISGSSTLTKKLGTSQTSITTACTLNNINPVIISNNTNIYYVCTATNLVKQVPIMSGTSSTYFAIQTPSGVNNKYLFSTMQNIMTISSSGSGSASVQSTKTANTTFGVTPSSWQVTNQKISTSTSGLKYNMNTTSLQTVSTNACEINFKPTNTTKLVDSIACDQSIPAMTVRYWNGFMIQKVANYNTNSTQTFLNSIDASAYKKLLSLPCLILVNENPCITFIATDQTQVDYLVVLTSTHVYYGNAQTALNLLQNHNYALQSYDIITTLTSSNYEIQNPILQGITLYGFNLNTTVNKAGLFTLPSGYTTKTTTINSAIRTIDPQWTDDATDIPIITTSSSLFPIFLTASNAPAFAAIKVTSATQIINGQEAVYAVAQLDSTRSVEFDMIAGTCANIYIADISVSPSVWNFQGIICATGVNQKTIAYTNTVPFTFYTLKYGATDSYTPSNNGLTTTFHTNVAPTTYTVIIRNSTGTIAINQTFTVPANQTTDTRSFNVSSVTKPAALSVTVGGNQIYTAYLGSSLSLASTASFFHQYFSYQGFDLLSFIPIVFASMFTRNTIGVGMALTVVCIATLSWLSFVVVPEPVVYVSIFVACIGIIGYRSIYG